MRQSTLIKVNQVNELRNTKNYSAAKACKKVGVALPTYYKAAKATKPISVHRSIFNQSEKTVRTTLNKDGTLSFDLTFDQVKQFIQ